MGRYTRIAGTMRCARTAWAQCGILYVGRSEILRFVAHMADRTILGIIRASDTTTGWFIGALVLLGTGALTLHRGLLIRTNFGEFVVGALVLGYRGERF